MRFSIANIPIKVQPVFFALAALLALHRLATPHLLIAWIAIVFVSVLIHELGHAFAFRKLGYRPDVELHGMGGHTRAQLDRPLSPKQDIMVSLAGPMAGFAFGAIVLAATSFLPVLTTVPFLKVIASDLLWVNFGWGLLNLLPILPMDGGRVLVSALRMKQPMRADELAHAISAAVAGVLALIALAVYGSIFGAVLIGWFGYNNFETYRRYRAARERWR